MSSAEYEYLYYQRLGSVCRILRINFCENRSKKKSMSKVNMIMTTSGLLIPATIKWNPQYLKMNLHLPILTCIQNLQAHI